MNTSPNAKNAVTSKQGVGRDNAQAIEHLSDSLRNLILRPATIEVAQEARGLFQNFFGCDDWDEAQLTLLSSIKRGLAHLCNGEIDPGQAIPYLVSNFELLKDTRFSNSAYLAATYELETLFPSSKRKGNDVKRQRSDLVVLKTRQ